MVRTASRSHCQKERKIGCCAHMVVQTILILANPWKWVVLLGGNGLCIPASFSKSGPCPGERKKFMDLIRSVSLVESRLGFLRVVLRRMLGDGHCLAVKIVSLQLCQVAAVLDQSAAIRKLDAAPPQICTLNCKSNKWFTDKSQGPEDAV